MKTRCDEKSASNSPASHISIVRLCNSFHLWIFPLVSPHGARLQVLSHNIFIANDLQLDASVDGSARSAPYVNANTNVLPPNCSATFNYRNEQCWLLENIN